MRDWFRYWKYRSPFWGIRHFANSKIFHTHDHWGMKFNKPIQLFKHRYTVASQTYYR